MNPFASHQLIYDGGRVIVERVFAELSHPGGTRQPAFESDSNIYGGAATGRWLGMQWPDEQHLTTFTLSNPTSTLQQTKAWGHRLEWYAHDGDLDGELSSFVNFLVDLDSGDNHPVDISAFVDHGIFGQPRIAFAAEAFVDGKGEPFDNLEFHLTPSWLTSGEMRKPTGLPWAWGGTLWWFANCVHGPSLVLLPRGG